MVQLIQQIFHNLIIVLLLSTNFLKASAISGSENEDLHSRVPAPLTSTNFDSELKEGFHVVEFFSPKCPHCVQLFPKWVEFYEMNQPKIGTSRNDKEKESNKFKIHQVDCLTSGDLCDREGIQYYPMIRFYGSGSKLLGSMTSSDRTPEKINEFANDQFLVWSGSNDNDLNIIDDEISDIEFNNLLDKNRLIGSEELIKIIEGENTVPRLISFWPTSDEEWNDAKFQDDYNKNKIFTYFPNLFSFRNLWNLTMKNLQKYINDDKLHFNYFNCKSNKEICKSLGFGHLTSNKIKESLSPEVILYLPKNNGGNAIYYKRKYSDFRNLNTALKSLTHWTYRTLVNSEFEDLTFKDIVSFVDTKTKLNKKGSISEFTDYSKVAFIQVNDPETYVPEDDSLLERLIQPIADLESDVYLFKTNDKDEVMKFLKQQETSMIDKYLHINNKNEEEKEINFDESMFVSRTHTTFPMMICIKSGSLYSPVYTSFMSKQMRDANKILNFIKSNHLPIINHLSIDSKDEIFPLEFHSNINDKSEKVLITLTDFQPKQFFDTEFFLSFIFHKFVYVNNKSKFLEKENKRVEKYDDVSKLKENDASSDDIIEALREKIDISYTTTDNFVYPVYVDIKQFPLIVSAMKWNNIDPSNYKIGDAILIDRFSGSYWDKDTSNNRLTIDDPSKTIDLLKAVSYDNFKGRKLQNWSNWIKIPTYILFAYLTYLLVRGLKSFLQRKQLHMERMKGLGILGISPDLEESKFD